MIDLMEMLWQHCPKLKYLYVDGQVGVRPIELISIRNPIQQGSFQDKDQFQNLESIRIYFHGMSFLQGTEEQMNYFKDYLIAKCAKIIEITTELDTDPELDEDDCYGDDFLYDISISVCSVPYTNFYLWESRLFEQEVTQRYRNHTDEDDDEEEDDNDDGINE